VFLPISASLSSQPFSLGKAGSLSRLRYVWIVVFCALVFSIGQFQRAAGGILSPVLADEMSLSASALGSVIGAMFIATMAAQIPAGVALDRFGPRRVLPVMLMLAGLGSILFSQAVALEWVYAGRILLGIGFASSSAAAHILFSRWFPQDRFAQISGIMVSIGGIGGLAGTYPLATVVEVAGWRPALLVIGLLTLAIAVLGSVTIRNAPPHVPRPVFQPTGWGAMLGGFREIFANRDFPKLLVIGTVAFAPITTIAGLWGGPYFHDVHGLTVQETGAVLFALFLTSMVAGLIVGPLDRLLGTRKKVVLVGVAGSVLCFLLLAGLEGLSANAAMVLLLAMTFCQNFYLTLSAHNRALVADHLVGRASTLMTVAAVAGIPVMQSGFGLMLDWGRAAGLSDAEAYRLGFLFMAGFIVLASLWYTTAEDRRP